MYYSSGIFLTSNFPLHYHTSPKNIILRICSYFCALLLTIDFFFSFFKKLFLNVIPYFDILYTLVIRKKIFFSLHAFYCCDPRDDWNGNVLGGNGNGGHAHKINFVDN